MMSLKAAPIPVTKPYQRPLFSVRWMQSTPTGPMGADATTPMSNPFMIKSNVLTGSNHIIGAKLAFFHETIKKSPFFFYFS